MDMAWKFEFIFGMIENILGKEENAGFQNVFKSFLAFDGVSLLNQWQSSVPESPKDQISTISANECIIAMPGWRLLQYWEQVIEKEIHQTIRTLTSFHTKQITVPLDNPVTLLKQWAISCGQVLSSNTLIKMKNVTFSIWLKKRSC